MHTILIEIHGGGFAKFLVLSVLPNHIPHDLITFLADSASLIKRSTCMLLADTPDQKESA